MHTQVKLILGVYVGKIAIWGVLPTHPIANA